MNENVFIEKISLDKNGILSIAPKNGSFEFIYRSATGVRWNENKRCLFHKLSVDDVSVLWLYKEILSAIKSEYGVILKISPETIFENLNSSNITDIKG
ncbi:MAG: hypothetical protein LBT30_07400 [Clostridiales bacterium]|jgi:hypothetical protein|nr:hypothetical protein [Clostridiales bacterium]